VWRVCMWRVCVIGESTTGIGHGLGCESDAHRRAQTTEEGTAHERVLFCFLVFHDSLTTPPSRKNRNVTKCMLCSCCRRAVNAVRALTPMALHALHSSSMAAAGLARAKTATTAAVAKLFMETTPIVVDGFFFLVLVCVL
jgi:hypothetical protein